MTEVPSGYRRSQIFLHWFVALGVLVLFFTGEQTTEAFQAGGDLRSAWVGGHAFVGTLILCAMLWRVHLRWTVGVPSAPRDQSMPLRALAHVVHVGLYLGTIGAALLGVAAYLHWAAAGEAHDLVARLPLIVLFPLHVAGALWHHFYLRDNVMRRMIDAEKRSQNQPFPKSRGN